MHLLHSRQTGPSILCNPSPSLEYAGEGPLNPSQMKSHESAPRKVATQSTLEEHRILVCELRDSDPPVTEYPRFAQPTRMFERFGEQDHTRGLRSLELTQMHHAY